MKKITILLLSLIFIPIYIFCLIKQPAFFLMLLLIIIFVVLLFKAPKFLFILIISLTVLFYFTKLPLCMKAVHPVRIKVISQTTKKPLKNINIIYTLESVRHNNYFGLKDIFGCEDYKKIIIKNIKTNEQGEVYLPKKIIFLHLYEDIYKELFHINLNLKTADIMNKNNIENFNAALIARKGIINPNTAFKGFIVGVSSNEDEAKEIYKIKLFHSKGIKSNFSGKELTFIIELPVQANEKK